MPMPTSATARISPKVKTDPPRSGPSIRYHTSSIRKNAKPTTADATSRNHVGAAGEPRYAGAAATGSDSVSTEPRDPPGARRIDDDGS